MSQYYPLTDEEVRLARVIAKKATRKWKTVDFDDCNSNLLLFMLDPERLWIVMDCRPEMDSSTLNQGYLYTMLNNEANRFCQEETEANVHTELDTYNFYTEAKLAKILSALSKIDFAEFEMNADTSSIPYTVAADVISVFNGLSPEDKRLLNLRFKEDLTGKALAEVLNTTENNASQRVHRALKKLRFKLSGEPSVWVPDRKEEHKDMYQ